MPQILLDLLRADQAPGTSLRRPASGQQEVVQLQALREGLRLAGRLEDAHPHAHAALQVPTVRESLLPALAPPGTHPDAHGREALLLPALFPLIRRPVQLESSPPNPFGRQALLVQVVRKDVFSHVAPIQTRRRRMLRNKHIRTVSHRPSGRSQERSRLNFKKHTISKRKRKTVKKKEVAVTLSLTGAKHLTC